MENNAFRKRLAGVTGYSDRLNDIYVTGDIDNSTQHVIYFGGDIQDYPEAMEAHRDNKRYVEWNTEATAHKLFLRFPNSLVIVIKPAYMFLSTFSVYSNFWETSETGGPVHTENFNALEHLRNLYTSVLGSVSDKKSIPENIPLNLVGFSKGCTVLNQLVYELHLIEENEHLKKFAQKIKCFYWLDGGHNERNDTWVTQDAPLQSLTSLGCEIKIHVSPYQVKDDMRPWVGKDASKFYKKLKDLHANVERVKHFESEPSSIDNHFNILNEF